MARAASVGIGGAFALSLLLVGAQLKPSAGAVFATLRADIQRSASNSDQDGQSVANEIVDDCNAHHNYGGQDRFFAIALWEVPPASYTRPLAYIETTDCNVNVPSDECARTAAALTDSVHVDGEAFDLMLFWWGRRFHYDYMMPQETTNQGKIETIAHACNRDSNSWSAFSACMETYFERGTWRIEAGVVAVNTKAYYSIPYGGTVTYSYDEHDGKFLAMVLPYS